ncbi:hypothetical protein TWF696_007350 [Orbilia brochopaga]|uniref:Uncharacterized protein n=1 Tax=Orbilia brochopaga TaxID=3140254 RepID=A0AAV9UT62_9PEZI
MDGLDHEPGQTMRWSNSRTRVNDPDLKEPYYLEGPGDQTKWNWLANLNSVSGGSLAASLSGGGLLKRDAEAPNNTTDTTSVPV